MLNGRARREVDGPREDGSQSFADAFGDLLLDVLETARPDLERCQSDWAVALAGGETHYPYEFVQHLARDI